MSFIDIFIVNIFCLSGSMDLLSKVVSVVLLFVHKHTHADSQIPQRPDMHHGAELPLDADKVFSLSWRMVALNPECSWCAWRTHCRNRVVKLICHNILYWCMYMNLLVIKLSNLLNIVFILVLVYLAIIRLICVIVVLATACLIPCEYQWKVCQMCKLKCCFAYSEYESVKTDDKLFQLQ